MNSPTPGTGENLDSTAKLMLEALSKASSELDKTIVVLTEQLGKFNQELEKSFQTEIQAARERMEGALRQNLDGLMRDKEAVMKSLADFRQAEIDRVILSGKTLRSGLAAQVEDATRELSSTVAGRIGGIRELLAGPEMEMKRKYEEIQGMQRHTAEESQLQLGNTRVNEETRINELDRELEVKLLQAVTTGQRELEETFGLRKTELDANGEKITSELASKYDEAASKLEDSHQRSLMNISSSKNESSEKLTQLAGTGSVFLQEQDKAFSSTLEGLSGLLNGLFETRLNNLVAQSRTEIISAAQHAEECLGNTKSELQVCLKEFQRDYVAKFEALNTKLEKTLDDYTKGKEGGALRGLKEERIREQLNNLFRRLGQEMIDSAANAAKTLEQEFQKSMDAFEQRIETARTQACESLERESKLMQKELNRTLEEFEKQMNDLHLQSTQLEKQGRDAANIVMTIKQANLDF